MRIFDNSVFTELQTGFSCSVAEFERIKRCAFTMGLGSIEMDMHGNPVCSDWIFTHTAGFSYDYRHFHDVDSLSLLEVRDGWCYFELDLELSNYLPEGTCLSIDRGWRVPLESLITVLEEARDVERDLRSTISQLRSQNVRLRNAAPPRQQGFVEPLKGECPICFEETHCMFTCGHHCCRDCFENLKLQGDVKCSICRAAISFESTTFD